MNRKIENYYVVDINQRNDVEEGVLNRACCAVMDVI